jgi:hypothetical protein
MADWSFSIATPVPAHICNTEKFFMGDMYASRASRLNCPSPRPFARCASISLFGFLLYW